MSTHVPAADFQIKSAAQTPEEPHNVNVTSEAENKVEGSGAAGVSAYIFDPDASPEEKAAQARSRVPEGFHHQHKSKAVAVATDLDDDNTPSTYNLPPVAQVCVRDSNDPQEEKNQLSLKSAIDEKANLEEDARWIERAGWAPRFGNPSTASIDGEALIDHQTWVEGRLDDKFFGDWYHNTAVIIFACLSSWLVATLGGGLAWIFIIMAICGTYYRTSLRRVRRNFRDDITRELALNRLETETESLEWINSFLVKFWPIFQPVFAETIINSVDQVLSNSTPSFLDSLRMKTFTLGSKPPRMEHVKTYPKAEDDIVLMDWKFSFNPMDQTDMTSKQIRNKVNPKVVLEVRIGKAMISKGLDVIVEDMAFSGLMRMKIKLQIPFPHVDKIEISFLEKPHIDYVCKPLGGETLGFDINFVPGLESFILDQIHANIGPVLYAPNVLPIEVAKMLSGSSIDQAVGVLAVTIYGAQGLKNPDKFAGTPDPYVQLSFNCGATLAKTKTIKENPNPKWNETKYVIVTTFTDNLTLQVFDFNEFRKDKELGTASFPLDLIQEIHTHENEQLEIVANGKARGELLADIRFFPVLEGRALPDGSHEPPPESNTGIARIVIEQAKDLDGTKSLIGQLNPYAVLLLNNKEIHITRKLKRTNNPIWDNGSKEILITDRKTAKIGLIIKDDRDLATDPILGSYQIKLDDMIQLVEKGQEWYNLAGAKTGRAKMLLQWKPIALSGVGIGSGGYVTPIGVMRFHFKDARNLRNLETLGKSDPYARVLLSGIEKGRTVTFKNNLNPDWNEIVYVPVHSPREKLTLEVMDEETLGNDRSLGLIEIIASDYVVQEENGDYRVFDPSLQSGQLCMHGKGSPRGTLNYTIAFYPCLNTVDPDNEKTSRNSSDTHQMSSDTKIIDTAKNSEFEAATPQAISGETDNIIAARLAVGEEQQDKTTEEKQIPAKIQLSPSELFKYESGLIILKLISVDVSKTNVHVEIIMDDMAFPSYSSPLIRSKNTTLDEYGDCVVRELDVSKITFRIREKGKTQGEGKKNKDQTLARLTKNSLDTLKQCFNNPTCYNLTNEDGELNRVTISMKYIPLKMTLDPSESISNMGKIRVDVLNAVDLPSADRNGYSDPYCKFELNGKDVFKTKVHKKTLNPNWNESFEVDVASRATAQFKCTVYDWDFGDKADVLGTALIDLSQLEPFKAQDFSFALDGKSGMINLRLLFKSDYVTRLRQGSSAIVGTFATPGKIVTGVAGVPLKGVGIAAHGVGKGATFIRNGFKNMKKSIDETNNPEFFIESTNVIGGSHDESRRVSGQNLDVRSVSSLNPNTHVRTKSFGASSIHSTIFGGSSSNTGTATFTILSASGYPPSTNLMVCLKMIGPKSRTIHKTEHIKSSTGYVKFDDRRENFKCSCAADTQFQIQVKDHKIFGSDEDLGEGIFFVDESGTGTEKQVKIGNGYVVVKSNFVRRPEADELSPRSSSGFRKSFLGIRDNGKSTRETSSPTGT
ncbi:Uncharacterized protein K3495_g2798 [Podosphaera aphanis]|nr:Uncharacterized protein K3495_g2798 [Podosphaera aphanis]